jgi:hypothetical protein
MQEGTWQGEVPSEIPRGYPIDSRLRRRGRYTTTMRPEDISTITDETYLNKIIDSGWMIRGPRKDSQKDLHFAKNFFKRNITFVPEHVLEADGFKVVSPCPFTRGYQLMFKDEGRLIRYTRSRYTLISENHEIPLYIILNEDKTDF